jgi:hypothetical protein
MTRDEKQAAAYLVSQTRPLTTAEKKQIKKLIPFWEKMAGGASVMAKQMLEHCDRHHLR